MMGKKLRRGILGLAMLGVFLLGACQPTPEKEIVVNKNDGAFESALEASAGPESQEAAQEEEIWSDSFTRKNVSVEINAKITLPETEHYAVQKVRTRNFTEEELQKFVKVLFGDNPVRRFESYTKADREEQLIYAKETLEKMLAGDESVIDPGEPLEEQIARQQEEIENIEESIATASDTTDTGEEIPVEFTTDEEWDITSFEGCTTLNGTTAWINASADANGVKNVGSMSFERDKENYLKEQPVDTGQPEIAEEAALEQALKVAEQLGIGDIALERTEIASGGKDDYAYRFIFARMYEGIPLTNPQLLMPYQDEDFEEVYNTVYNPERIVIAVDEKGIRAIDWSYPCEIIETVNENVTIKPLEEAKELFRGYLYQTNASIGEKGMAATEIEISEVQLAAAMMRVKNGEEGEFYIIPVWDFLGKGTETDPVNGQKYAMTLEWQPAAAFVTVNAIDGSNFDRFYMY